MICFALLCFGYGYVDASFVREDDRIDYFLELFLLVSDLFFFEIKTCTGDLKKSLSGGGSGVEFCVCVRMDKHIDHL